MTSEILQPHSSPPAPSFKDEVSLPWLNSIFTPQGFKTISSFSWEGSASNGLGLMSSMDRLNLKLVDGSTLRVIFKTLPPKGSQLREITVSNGFAIRELNMYTNLFKLWEDFLDSQHVPQKYRFRKPKCYYGASSGIPQKENYEQVLILEDLFTSGFKLWEDGYGKNLSWDHAKSCIRLIAQFHAVGLAYKKVSGIKNYQEEMPFLNHFMEGWEQLAEMFFSTGFDVFTQFLEEFARKAEAETGCNCETLKMPDGMMEQIQILKENAVYNLRFLEPSAEQVGTVLHNDVHVNNFMFLEDAHSAVFFDFQASTYSLPTKDLSFFLIKNCEDAIFTTQLHSTIEYYHDELHAAMNAMGVALTNYSLDKIIEEYRSTVVLSLLHIIAGAQGFGLTNDSDVTEHTRRQFYNAVVKLYKEGLLECALKPKTHKIKE